MYIQINKKKYKIRVCTHFRDKLFGLMFKKDINEIIYLKNTNSIHTFFMKENIDVIFLKDYEIKKIYYNVKPCRIICGKGNGVLEMPKGTIKNNDKIVVFNQI